MYPTQKSLDLVEEISKSIKTFHHHYHILYDIAEMFVGHINFFEIGTFQGASSALMLQRPNVTIITLDTGTYVKREEVIGNLNKFNIHKNIFWYIEEDSHQMKTKDKVKSIDLITPGIDILFIDGDHSEKGVTIDFLLYNDLIRKGGYVVFDDYNDYEFNPQVKLAVDRIMSERTGWEVIGSIKNTLNAPPADHKDGICYVIQKR
jgi:predicted O-methyltransferase YrrM